MNDKGWLNNIGGRRTGVSGWQNAQTEAGRQYQHTKEQKKDENKRENKK